MTETTSEKPTSHKATAILGLRTLQILSMALTVVGFIWASGDYLTSLFPANSVVTPTSVLLMLYGSVGSFGLEGIIRFLSRKK